MNQTGRCLPAFAAAAVADAEKLPIAEPALVALVPVLASEARETAAMQIILITTKIICRQ